MSHRATLSEILAAGITIPDERSIWTDSIEPIDWLDANDEEVILNVAFRTEVALIPNLLWCALSTQFGYIRPQPYCQVYLFNLEKRIMALPYDDRGMDVVGPNHALLAAIFRKHYRYLLEHDISTMRQTFRDETLRPLPR
ncbi:hypothetical protein PAN31117_05239 [Pandoraea anapnoica]|uniref:DUF3885 domain-containing protein n=2 Tax=Burkholderiaceae TaxID=119060 RepID=A0A5E5ARV5_9BURK|nr:hypothetical protein PIN31009_05489 [Pandoraea iniqua]VVE75747.1 hypothetical protein PAN31117_05239 [Pandoraea anapnoica]